MSTHMPGSPATLGLDPELSWAEIGPELWSEFREKMAATLGLDPEFLNLFRKVGEQMEWAHEFLAGNQHLTSKGCPNGDKRGLSASSETVTAKTTNDGEDEAGKKARRTSTGEEGGGGGGAGGSSAVIGSGVSGAVPQARDQEGGCPESNLENDRLLLQAVTKERDDALDNVTAATKEKEDAMGGILGAAEFASAEKARRASAPEESGNLIQAVRGTLPIADQVKRARGLAVDAVAKTVEERMTEMNLLHDRWIASKDKEIQELKERLAAVTKEKDDALDKVTAVTKEKDDALGELKELEHQLAAKDDAFNKMKAVFETPAQVNKRKHDSISE